MTDRQFKRWRLRVTSHWMDMNARWPQAENWAGSRTGPEAWRDCERGDFMIWWLIHDQQYNHQAIVEFLRRYGDVPDPLGYPLPKWLFHKYADLAKNIPADDIRAAFPCPWDGKRGK